AIHGGEAAGGVEKAILSAAVEVEVVPHDLAYAVDPAGFGDNVEIRSTGLASSLAKERDR
ncbi:MAG TPA: hypothetical protein VH477_04105, partial [Bryobacteraceae bacterium]